MNIRCTWRFTIVADDVSTVPAEVDRIMEHLVALEDARVHDAAVGLDLASMRLEISVSVITVAPEQGVQAAMAAIRTAIHAAGGATPGWPDTPIPTHGGLQLLHGELVAA